VNDVSTSGARPTPDPLFPLLNNSGAEREDRIAVRNLFELLAWLIAASGGLYMLNYTLLGQYRSEGPGMHPLSFFFFTLAFFALNARQFTLFPATLLRLEPQLSRALVIALALFVVLRLAESAWGRPFAALTLIGGDAFGTTAYASWGTALGILLLFSMATFCPKLAPKTLATLSYLLFWSLVLTCLHTLLHWTELAQGGFLLPSLSGTSAFALLCLALVFLPRSAVWDTLFDPRTPQSTYVACPH